MKRRLFLALVAALVLLTLTAYADTALTILATTDIHGNLLGYDYAQDMETQDGLGRIAAYVEKVRQETGTLLLIDNGDTFQGTILTDQVQGQPAMIAAMNLMGYDTMTLGNHDFNFGTEFIENLISLCDFPILSANTLLKNGSPFVGDYVVFERGGLSIAIIGVTTPNVARWDAKTQGISELDFEDMSKTVSTCIEKIGDSADIIIVSAHAGLAPEFDVENRSDSAQKILDENPAIDVLLVGHYHILVNEKQGTAIIGGTRNSAREITRIDLTLNDGKEIVSSTCELIPVADLEPDERITALAAATHQAALAAAKEKSLDSLGEWIGEATGDFQPANENPLIPAARLQDTALLDLINTVQLEASGADVSSAALFVDASGIAKGPIYESDVAAIYKYDNDLVRVSLTGAQLKSYMEWSANYYAPFQPGDTEIAPNPDIPGYLYDVFAGVTYQINITKAAGERIQNLLFKGQPLQDDQTLTLCLNNYRFNTTLMQEGIVTTPADWTSQETLVQLITHYIKQNTPIEPTVDSNWEIVK